MKASALNRREFLKSIVVASIGTACGSLAVSSCTSNSQKTDVFAAKAANYNAGLRSVMLSGLHELGVSQAEIEGKRILLKPNIVEPHRDASHIVTHPSVVIASAEAFLSLGAAHIVIGEGSGHCRDTHMILEESGYLDILRNNRISFVDLNNDSWFTLPNKGNATKLTSFMVPSTLGQVDWLVSMPKMKTHHWAGVTLSMKNLFGVLPGIFYGWPKNVLHVQGINKSIIDINATLRPHFAIVDGIVGMEGDGPIMGSPKEAGIIAMGRNLPAVDATCARVMGINPRKVKYLSKAGKTLGPIKESLISQRGEDWRTVRTDFQLLDHIHAQQGLRLS